MDALLHQIHSNRWNGMNEQQKNRKWNQNINIIAKLIKNSKQTNLKIMNITESIKYCLIAVIGLISTLSFAQSLKVSTASRWSENWGQYVKELAIVSTEDSVTINKILLNRGNCDYPMTFRLPYTLKYGQKLNVMLSRCEILEVQIDTNKGTQTYKFR